MPEVERLSAPRFRLPDGSVATIRGHGPHGLLEGVRTLPSGVTVKFSVGSAHWEHIRKERIEEP